MVADAARRKGLPQSSMRGGQKRRQGGALEQRVRGWLYVAAMTRFLMRAGLVISGGVAAASYGVVVACASRGA